MHIHTPVSATTIFFILSYVGISVVVATSLSPNLIHCNKKRSRNNTMWTALNIFKPRLHWTASSMISFLPQQLMNVCDVVVVAVQASSLCMVEMALLKVCVHGDYDTFYHNRWTVSDSMQVFTWCDCCWGIAYPISLVCMSAHKPLPLGVSVSTKPDLDNLPSRHLPQSPLRRLALRVLFISQSTSYQTACTVFERSSIKGTGQCKPTWSSSFALRQLQQKLYTVQ